MKKVIMMLFALVMLVSCNKEGDTIYEPDPAERQASTAPVVIVVHNVEGVGDQSYNDLIYKGVEEAALQYGLRTLQLTPKTQKEAQAYLESVFQQLSTAKDTVPRLCIVANSSCDDFVRNNNKLLENNSHASLLYLETTRQLDGKGSTLYMPYYGAMYEAGCIAPYFASDVTVVAANPKLETVTKAVEGFEAGFQTTNEESGSKLNTIYLSEKADSGFTIDDERVLIMLQENEINNYYFHMIVPICGGAASTFARLAAITEGYAIMGVDVKWSSPYSHFSAVKHIDRAIVKCIVQWLSAEGMPKHQSLGLASGFTEVLLHPQSNHYKEVISENKIEQVLADIHQQAIRKEAENDQ